MIIYSLLELRSGLILFLIPNHFIHLSTDIYDIVAIDSELRRLHFFVLITRFMHNVLVLNCSIIGLVDRNTIHYDHIICVKFARNCLTLNIVLVGEGTTTTNKVITHWPPRLGSNCAHGTLLTDGLQDIPRMLLSVLLITLIVIHLSFSWVRSHLLLLLAHIAIIRDGVVVLLLIHSLLVG